MSLLNLNGSDDLYSYLLGGGGAAGSTPVTGQYYDVNPVTDSLVGYEKGRAPIAGAGSATGGGTTAASSKGSSPYPQAQTVTPTKSQSAALAALTGSPYAQALGLGGTSYNPSAAASRAGTQWTAEQLALLRSLFGSATALKSSSPYYGFGSTGTTLGRKERKLGTGLSEKREGLVDTEAARRRALARRLTTAV